MRLRYRTFVFQFRVFLNTLRVFGVLHNFRVSHFSAFPKQLLFSFLDFTLCFFTMEAQDVENLVTEEMVSVLMPRDCEYLQLV